MPYIVLARKYRPQKFDELVGQDHITQLLKQSFESKRLGSAYLFCGPRGIGKTSCARILAKSLNCQKGPTLDPCGECSPCKEIANATSFDVIEIDGASNRGIDEIRTLRENVKFAPSYGRFKIYIVDEVHMLTTEAFNALLKTLEEPPEHVKFILATTAPSKIPATIISRCQRFDFKRLSVTTISQTLEGICKKEKLKIESEALFAIAKAASGSMRDALSILDQLSSISERKIEAGDVVSMLGTVEVELLFELADHLSQKNCKGALEVLDKIIDKGKDVKQLARDLTEHFRNLMIMKIGGKSLGALIDYPLATKEVLLAQCEKFSLPQIIKMIDLLIESQETSRIMDSLRIPLEISFAKFTQIENASAAVSPAAKMIQPIVSAPAKASSYNPPVKAMTAPVKVLSNEKGFVALGVDESEKKETEETFSATPEDLSIPQELNLEIIRSMWDSIVHGVSRQRMSVGTYLQEGFAYAVKGTVLTIGFPPEASFHKESLEHKDNSFFVERIFSEKLKTNVKLEFKIIDGIKPQEQEPFVKEALETFKGKVVSKWQNE